MYKLPCYEEGGIMKLKLSNLIVLIFLLIIFPPSNLFPEEKLTEEQAAGNSDNLLKKITKYIPNNYFVLNIATGDLDLDNIEDIILVVRKDNEDKTSNVIDHPEKRPLFILIGKSDQSYKLAAKNNNAVLCFDCGGVMGDPFVGITIKEGYFSIEHNGGSNWRWIKTATFKYSKEKVNWYLYKDEGIDYHTTALNESVSKVKTAKDFGIVPFEEYDIYKE